MPLDFWGFWELYINLIFELATATSMERLQGQQEPVQATPVRRPKFPGESLIERPEGAQKRAGGKFRLLESEGKFVDPSRETAVMMPEQAVFSSPLALESHLAPKYTEATVVAKKSIVSSLYEYLLSVLELFKKSFRGSRRRGARLTRRGEEALTQLQYLAALCDATTCRTPEEIIAAESAFGEAYYEIMRLSSELEKMAQKEQAHHVHKYKHHMSRFLSSAEV